MSWALWGSISMYFGPNLKLHDRMKIELLIISNILTEYTCTCSELCFFLVEWSGRSSIKLASIQCGCELCVQIFMSFWPTARFFQRTNSLNLFVDSQNYISGRKLAKYGSRKEQLRAFIEPWYCILILIAVICDLNSGNTVAISLAQKWRKRLLNCSVKQNLSVLLQIPFE